MKKRKLGKYGPQLSEIGFGAMSFSDFWGVVDDDQSIAILDACLNHGINHLDTANVYGNGVSESRIGKYLARYNKGSKCPFYLATKAGIKKDDDGNRTYINTKEYLTGELEKSLKRLGTDHVDLFYVHRRQPNIPIEEVTEGLASLVESGKTLNIGFSEIAPSSLLRAHSVHPIAAVQSEFSLSTRYPELGLINRCDETETSLIAYSPVGRGLLTEKSFTAEEVKSNLFMSSNPRFLEPNLSHNLEILENFKKLAADMETSCAAIAIAWTLAQAKHIIPIPGTRSLKHLKQLVDGCNLHLSDNDLKKINQCLPVGWAHGERYSHKQWHGPEGYA